MNSSAAAANTSIQCNVKSSVYINITWLRDGFPLSGKESLKISNLFLNTSDHLLSVSTLTFTSLEEADSGLYKCVYSKPAMNGETQEGSANCSLDVSKPLPIVYTTDSANRTATTDKGSHLLFCSNSNFTNGVKIRC